MSNNKINFVRVNRSIWDTKTDSQKQEYADSIVFVDNDSDNGQIWSNNIYYSQPKQVLSGSVGVAVEKLPVDISDISATVGVDKYRISLNTSNASNGDVLTAKKSNNDTIGVEWAPLSIPTASNTLGVVRTTSTIVSDLGLTACPIINGIVYYKEGSDSGGGSSVQIDALKTELIYNAGELKLNSCKVTQNGETIIDSFGNLSVATTSKVGGIKIGYDENGKNYAVKLDGSNKAYVNVDWEDFDTKNTAGSEILTVDNGQVPLLCIKNTQYNNGNGYTQTYTTGFSSEFYPQANICWLEGVGDNTTLCVPKVSTTYLSTTYLRIDGKEFDEYINDVSTGVATDSEIGGIKLGYTENGKNYPVKLDNDKAYVNVQWTDTKNTTGSSNNVDKLYLIGATSQSSQGIQTYSNSNVYIQSNALHVSRGFFESSDERLKNFSERITIDLDKLSELKKNYFTWNDSGNEEQQLGVSAQEIRELYPEIVSEQDNGILTVAYDKLSVIALAAIDELHKKNKELEERLTTLENKLK